MFTSVFRVLITYLFVLIVLRTMGKRQIGQMQPFEFVITLIIADLATVPMSEHTLPLLYGIIPVITLLLVHYLFTLLARKSMFFRKVLNGKNVVIMDPDGVNYSALKKLNLTFNDLIESTRIAGFMNLSDVGFVIAETNGKMSVIPKTASSPVVKENLAIKQDEATMPTIIVSDGKIMKTNSENIGIDSKKIEKFVLKLCGKNCAIKDICIFTLDNLGNAFIQKFNEKAISSKIDLKVG